MRRLRSGGRDATRPPSPETPVSGGASHAGTEGRSPWPRIGATFALLLLLVAPKAALSEGGEALPPPGDPAWRPLTFPRVDRHTVYEVVEIGGSPAFRARSDCSASGMILPMEGFDLSRTPRLSWRWKVERQLEIEDERSRSGDDFAARVYVMFRFDPEAASLWQRLRRRVAEGIYGVEVPGEALTYVWASGADRGQHWRSPYTDEVHLVALRSRADTGWQREIVDPLADYAQLTGKAGAPLLALAVMSDSDNVCQRTAAYFADFRLLAPAEGVPETAHPTGRNEETTPSP